jgi:hypothetical protein
MKHLGEQFAVFAHFRQRDLLDIRFDQITELVENRRPTRGRQSPPNAIVEGTVRGCHGAVDFGFAAKRYRAPFLAGEWINAAEGGAIRRVHPLTIDKRLGSGAGIIRPSGADILGRFSHHVLIPFLRRAGLPASRKRYLQAVTSRSLPFA